MMITTPWKTYREGGTKYRIRATYGMDYAFARRNNQEPYFSLTGEIERQARNNRWMGAGAGMVHEELVKHFPQLGEIVHWHLSSLVGPMHYIANAKYWWEDWTHGVGAFPRISPLRAFASTIAWGALPGEDSEAGLASEMTRPWYEVRDWLSARLTQLQRAFRNDMEAIGVWEGG
jgi:hypothetical protein